MSAKRCADFVAPASRRLCCLYSCGGRLLLLFWARAFDVDLRFRKRRWLVGERTREAPKNKKPGSSLSASLRASNFSPTRYFTFKNTIANVYSAMDSISTSAKINANRIAAAAPGLRARPSQAAAVALACA